MNARRKARETDRTKPQAGKSDVGVVVSPASAGIADVPPERPCAAPAPQTPLPDADVERLKSRPARASTRGKAPAQSDPGAPRR